VYLKLLQYNHVANVTTSSVDFYPVRVMNIAR